MFCAPQTWIWSIFHFRKSKAKLGLSSCTLYSLQGGRLNKVGTREISSVKTGTLLLVTIPNMLHLRGKWIPVAQALSAPAVLSTCWYPPSGLFTCRWFHASPVVPSTCGQPDVTLCCPLCLSFKKTHPFSVEKQPLRSCSCRGGGSSSGCEVLSTRSGWTCLVFRVSGVAWQEHPGRALCCSPGKAHKGS